ncbi:MAG: recombination regulator RecX [Burkholderiales bacterium]
MRAKPTLRARAVALLARREHTRAELAAKLGRDSGDEREIAPLLDELARKKLLSDDRYADARAHALGRKFGVARIEHELRARGVSAAVIARATTDARATEVSRAREAWRRRFGVPPADPLEKAKQMRFLRGRGFSFEAIRQVIASADGDD